MSQMWRNALFRLHSSGWNSEEIDEACEALHEACLEGVYEGTDVEQLTPEQIRSALNTDLDQRLLSGLQTIAALRGRQTSEADELRRALYDLDAFAYAFVADD